MKPGTILLQMLLVLGIACALGIVFNNANPLGLREGQRANPVGRKRDVATNSSSSSSSQQFRQRQGVTNLSNETIQAGPSRVREDGTPNTGLPAAPVAIISNAPSPTSVLTAPQFVSVTWLQAKAQLADGRTVLVDARMPSFFEAGHIPNAIPLPASSAPDELDKFKNQHPPPASPLIIYCHGEQCHLSHALATILTIQYGYTNIKVMSGGYTEYLRAVATSQPSEIK